MTLELYCHPFSGFSQKVLIALYENATPFQPELVNIMTADTTALKTIWPILRIPVLRDAARDRTIPESSIIIEYLQTYYPGPVRLIPDDPEQALATRLSDRFFDLHMTSQMLKIFTDLRRPAGKNDPLGVAQAKATLETALGILERDLAGRTWAAGESFTMADCAAAPPLFVANLTLPIGEGRPNLAAYFARLQQRPSVARVLEEAAPYRKQLLGR